MYVNAIQECVDMNQEQFDEKSRNAFEYAQTVLNDKKAIQQSVDLFEAQLQ